MFIFTRSFWGACLAWLIRFSPFTGPEAFFILGAALAYGLAVSTYNVGQDSSFLVVTDLPVDGGLLALLGVSSLIAAGFAVCAGKKPALVLLVWGGLCLLLFSIRFGLNLHIALFTLLLTCSVLFFLRALSFSRWLFGFAGLLFPLLTCFFITISLYEASVKGDFRLPQILALVESNAQETAAYLRDNPVLVVAWIAFPVFLGLVFVFWRWVRALPKAGRISDEVSFCVAVLLFAALTKTPPAHGLDFVTSSLFHYDKKAEAYHNGQSERLQKLAELGAHPTQATPDGPLVVVIGESANRNHLGLYGYVRPTTPFLQARKDAGDLYAFSNVVSPYVTTIISLTHALSFASVDSGKKYYDAGVPSLIEALRAAGFYTAWLSNQAEHGYWSQSVSDLAQAANEVWFSQTDGRTTPSDRLWDHNFYLTRPMDEVLLPQLFSLLDAHKGPSVIFVHLIGSHTSYASRYPASFQVFSQESDPEPELTNKRSWEKVNAYDNSIRYTDYVLDQMIRGLESRGGEAGLLYFSDHGESPFQSRSRDPAHVESGDIEVPFVLWLSKDYRTRHVQTDAFATSRTQAPFMLDHVPQVVLGLAGIDAPFYKPERDLLHRDFVPLRRMTMDGGMDVADFDESYCALTLRTTGFSVCRH